MLNRVEKLARAALLVVVLAGCASSSAQGPVVMTPAEARAELTKLQSERGFKPGPPRPVQSMEELLAIVRHDEIDRFEDATRFLEGKSGVDALTTSAGIELLWSDACTTVALVNRELAERAQVELGRLDEKKRSGREFTPADDDHYARTQKNVAFNARAEAALGVLARDHLAAGSELAREALRRFPSDPRTYRVAAFYYLMTGTWGRFDETMQRLAANEPDDADLLYLRALEAFKRHERRDETRAFLQRALSVNPELVRAQAKLVLIQDDIAASHAELVQLRALAPEHPVVRITGPIIDAEYELSRSFERARDGGASSTPAPPPAP